MTPDRIQAFLRCFYEQYLEDSFQGFEVEEEDEKLMEAIEQYDVHGYLSKNLDIYIQHCDWRKEYSILYNPKLFRISKESDPEAFNELEIFLIENIQLFFHTILEAALNTYILKSSSVKGLKIHMKPVDNAQLRLETLVDLAEEKMKKLNILPPAMG